MSKAVYVSSKPAKVLEFGKQGPPGLAGPVPEVESEPPAPQQGGLLYVLNGALWFKKSSGTTIKIAE